MLHEPGNCTFLTIFLISKFSPLLRVFKLLWLTISWKVKSYRLWSNFCVFIYELLNRFWTFSLIRVECFWSFAALLSQHLCSLCLKQTYECVLLKSVLSLRRKEHTCHARVQWCITEREVASLCCKKLVQLVVILVVLPTKLWKIKMWSTRLLICLMIQKSVATTMSKHVPSFIE